MSLSWVSCKYLWGRDLLGKIPWKRLNSLSHIKSAPTTKNNTQHGNMEQSATRTQTVLEWNPSICEVSWFHLFAQCRTKFCRLVISLQWFGDGNYPEMNLNHLKAKFELNAKARSEGLQKIIGKSWWKGQKIILCIYQSLDRETKGPPLLTGQHGHWSCNIEEDRGPSRMVLSIQISIWW